MRRTLFHLSIALLAFGIGSFIVMKFYLNTQDDLPEVELAQGSEVRIDDSSGDKKTKQSKFVEVAFRNLPCEDENLKTFWYELRDRTVSINTDYLERVTDCNSLIRIDESFDLNGDNQKEIFIRSESGYFCGNNCQVFWIFQQNKEKGLRKIFEAKGYLPVVKSTKTKGYKDIMFEVYASYIHFDNKLYKFNGTEYVPKKCWSESKLRKNRNGELVEGKGYVTEYHECKETEWVKFN